MILFNFLSHFLIRLFVTLRRGPWVVFVCLYLKKETRTKFWFYCCSTDSHCDSMIECIRECDGESVAIVSFRYEQRPERYVDV